MTVPAAARPGDGPEGETAAVPPPLGPGDHVPDAVLQTMREVNAPLAPGASAVPVHDRPMRVRPAARPGS